MLRVWLISAFVVLELTRWVGFLLLARSEGRPWKVAYVWVRIHPMRFPKHSDDWK